MNTSFKKMNGSFAAVLAVALTALTLAACGGGGGGGDTTPVPTSYTETVTCPDGTTKSATATTSSGAVEAAILACPGIDATKVVITPADKATAVSPDVIAASGITVATSSVLSTPSATDVTVSAGGTSVPGTVTMMTGAKGFKFTPSGKLLYGQTYTFAASIKDTLSKALAISSSFTTASVTCTAPQVPNVAGDACVTPATWWPPTFVPMGTKVYLDSTKAPAGAVVNGTFPGQTQSGLLPADCKITGDDCWKEAVRNGTIKFVATTAKNPNQPTRPIAFGFYKTVSTILWPGKLAYCSKPFFADDGTLVAPNDPAENRCSPDEGVYFISNDLGGILQEKNPATGVSACVQKKYDQVLDGWGAVEVTCP